MCSTPYKAPRFAGDLRFMAGAISPTLNDLEAQSEGWRRFSVHLSYLIHFFLTAEKRTSHRPIFSRVDERKGSGQDKKRRKRKGAHSPA